VLAHREDSASLDLAVIVLNEWWTPGAIPRDVEE
jgi:hypothetical protein